MSTQVKELVAVPHAAFVTDQAAFKQLVMMFDRIAVQALSVIVSDPNVAPPEFGWLAELGILFEFNMEKLANDHDYSPTFDRMGNDLALLMSAIGINVDETLATGVEPSSFNPFELLEMANRMNTDLTRLSASLLRNREHLDAYAIIPSEHSPLDQDDHGNHEVAKIILLTFPVADDDVTWQQVLEYRNGPNPQNKFCIVKKWISDVARGSLTPDEAEKKLEHLLNEYRTRLEIHQMKTTPTTLAAFVVTTPDVLDRFRPGERALFSVEHRKLTLLQGESTSAGSEVAYVIKTKPVFSF
jgi:hypothetical protein